MRLASWLVGVPLGAVATVFAVANRQDVRLDLWPLPDAIHVPAYGAVLVPLAVGLVTGGAMVWLSGAPGRLRARRDRHRLQQMDARPSD